MDVLQHVNIGDNRRGFQLSISTSLKEYDGSCAWMKSCDRLLLDSWQSTSQCVYSMPCFRRAGATEIFTFQPSMVDSFKRSSVISCADTKKAYSTSGVGNAELIWDTCKHTHTERTAPDETILLCIPLHISLSVCLSHNIPICHKHCASNILISLCSTLYQKII